MSEQKSARLSEDGRYRYTLSRRWDERNPLLGFVMLNPSTADHEKDDPTILRCKAFARRDGYGGIVVANLYAFRSPTPAALWKTGDPIGPDNDRTLRVFFANAAEVGVPIVAAWGTNAKPSRVSWVRSMPAADVLHHLGLTKDSHPKHPLARGYWRIPDDQPLTRWSAPALAPRPSAHAEQEGE